MYINELVCAVPDMDHLAYTGTLSAINEVGEEAGAGEVGEAGENGAVAESGAVVEGRVVEAEAGAVGGVGAKRKGKGQTALDYASASKDEVHRVFVGWAGKRKWEVPENSKFEKFREEAVFLKELEDVFCVTPVVVWP